MTIVTAENFTAPGEQLIAVNLRVGMIDVDLTPEAAEDLARQLNEAAAGLRPLMRSPQQHPPTVE